MKNKLPSKILLSLTLFSLVGQIAWVVENMYFNVFIYKIFNATASDISLMVAASAISATLTTVFMGAISDRIGKRKLFICSGYILWGISILSFSLIRLDIINAIFPTAMSAASVGVSLVIIMDCVMTFFGSTANDAAFNAWLTDSTDNTNRGSAEGINSMMPLIAILVVFGGFMSFNLDQQSSWSTIFIIIGAAVILIGILGIFIIKEPNITPTETGFLKNIIYGFLPSTIRQNKELYLSFFTFIIFNTSIQIFMPYLIIYYEVSLGLTDYVFIMAPAIIIASVVTAVWGKVYDKKGFTFSSKFSLLWLILGYGILYFFKSTPLVFIGSLLMMSGYLSGMAVFGAKIRDNTPLGKSGRLQGMRIFSQVLIPGVVGPFIGKTVLADAKTIIGTDGTENFVPSADIFLAAAIPILLLIIVSIFIKKNKTPPKMNKLDTPYDIGDIPHNYHPNPNFKRDSFINLNGEWDLSVVAKNNTTVNLGKIIVPFPPESDASNINRITKKNETLVYKKTFNFKKTNDKVLLHFGAVDCLSTVILNGKTVGSNQGGYLPFSFDVTDAILEGENQLIVLVVDALDKNHAYGKQKHKRGGMWYTPISGIWQTVWLEQLPESYIKDIKITTTLDSVTIKTTGGESKKTIQVDNKEYVFEGDSITIKIDQPLLWTPETPNIYNFTIISGKDTVDSYFALREVTVETLGDKSYICLNKKPYFFHGLLDQGYFADGIYMPKSEQGFKDDILKMKKLGFNMLRKHIKIEPDIFYYYCDIYGMAVFQDLVNSGKYSFLLDTALPTINMKKYLNRPASKKQKEIFMSDAIKTTELLHNHPSVLYYTIFNEGWGQHNATNIYKKLKALDPTRIWDTASGWFKNVLSDVQSEHVYFKKLNLKPTKTHPLVLSEFGGYSCKIEEHSFNPYKTYGYKTCKDCETFTADLSALYENEVIPMLQRGLCATVLTQVSDVEDETNGLLTYDRKVLKVNEEIIKKISDNLISTFNKQFE